MNDADEHRLNSSESILLLVSTNQVGQSALASSYNQFGEKIFDRLKLSESSILHFLISQAMSVPTQSKQSWEAIPRQILHPRCPRLLLLASIVEWRESVALIDDDDHGGGGEEVAHLLQMKITEYEDLQELSTRIEKKNTKTKIFEVVMILVQKESLPFCC